MIRTPKLMRLGLPKLPLNFQDLTAPKVILILSDLSGSSKFSLQDLFSDTRIVEMKSYDKN